MIFNYCWIESRNIHKKQLQNNNGNKCSDSV